MIDPSGIKLPEGQEFQIERVTTGVYIVENAYEGEYEYFDGRPMFKVENSSETAEQESGIDHVSPPAEVAETVGAESPEIQAESS